MALRRTPVMIGLTLVAVLVVGAAVATWSVYRGVERVSYELDAARERLGPVEPDEDLLAGWEPNPPPGSEPPASSRGSDGDGTDAEPAENDSGDDDSDGDDSGEDDSAERLRDVDTRHDVYLVVGSDAREELAGQRADVIMLAILPEDGAAPALVSLPRDLWIPDLCRSGRQRINAALNGCGSRASGEELLILTVEHFTGLGVDHYLEVDFGGFVDVVDAVGGVEICVDNPVRDRRAGLDLPGGCTQASGEQALAWARSRHTQELAGGQWRAKPGAGDLDRNQRQQELLLQVTERAVAQRSPRALWRTATELSETITLGSNAALYDFVRTAWQLRGLDATEVRRATLDVQPYRTSGGAQVLVPDEPFPAVLDALELSVASAEDAP